MQFTIKKFWFNCKQYNSIKFCHFHWWDQNLFFKNAALHIAVENGNVEIVKLLLTSDKLDVNIRNIFIFIIYKIRN